MQELKLGNLTITLSIDGREVRVKSYNKNVILRDQTIDEVAEIILYNFNGVSNFYKNKVIEDIGLFDIDDVNFISLEIVMYYLYMYNSWRHLYKGQENKDLRFDTKDFEAPSTHDLVFNYFKTKYPYDWEYKCSLLIGMELPELKTYYNSREDYYNK